MIKTQNKGEVDLVDPTFLRLLDRHCYKGFGSLKPKMIQGRELMAAESLACVKACANSFANGAKFIQASTMLEKLRLLLIMLMKQMHLLKHANLAWMN